MQAIIKELSEILDCRVKMSPTKKKGVQTQMQLKNGSWLLIERVLTEIETKFVEKWLTQSSQEEGVDEVNWLLGKGSIPLMQETLKCPLQLWRIQFKHNADVVYEIIKSTFTGDCIARVSPVEIVVYMTDAVITPVELVGLLETEALTQVKLTVSQTLNHVMQIPEAYQLLKELSELAMSIQMNTSVVQYDAMFFPMLMKRLKTLTRLDSEGKHMSDETRLLQSLLSEQIKSVDDQELEHTALVFLENNLNITDTANELFIHRNTLIYRINKLEHMTGYDIRKFNDAMHYYLSYLGDKIK